MENTAAEIQPAQERSDRFAIIGAGFCGLGLAAALKRQSIPFDCLEADAEIGGNWYHGVYETAHVISSRKTTSYSDWPMPDVYPDFPSAAQMLRYLNAYADHWDIRKHIEFNTRVTEVRPTIPYWSVSLESGEARRYRGVLVATGHHWDKRWPAYPGTFTGEMVHSKDYKRPDILTGKRVLVIGGGNSACDIASEAARFSKTSHISMRRGYWFMPKTMFGIPMIEFLKPWLPVWTQRWLLRTLLKIVVGRYENYNLPHPDHRIFEHHPTLNSQLLEHLKHGRITPHPDVSHFEGERVYFVDGSSECFDLVVCATGFHSGVPFLSDNVVRFREGIPQLVGGVFHPTRRHLYMFGFLQPRYGAGPLVSAGAEAVAAVIKAQESMEQPVGALLQRLGGKPQHSVLQDPHALLRQTRALRRIAPRLPMLERWLMPRVYDNAPTHRQTRKAPLVPHKIKRLRNLAGRVALVTGAASGIGRATAHELAQAGAQLILCDIDKSALQSVAIEISKKSRCLLAEQVDVSNLKEMTDFAAAVHHQIPAVDILVNNAGVGLTGGILDTSLENWQWIVSINLWGVIYGCHLFVPKMLENKRGGHIVNVASVLGYFGAAHLLGYVTTKFAVLGFAESLRAELREHGIGVSAICPGAIRTNIIANTRFPGAADSDATRDRFASLYRRRNYTPEKVAKAIVSAITRNRAVVPVSPEAWGMYHLKRYFPRLSQEIGRLIVSKLNPAALPCEK